MKNRKHIAMVVSLMLALSVVLGGALPTMAQADGRTFYESSFVATGSDADYYNERMEDFLNDVVTFFSERGDLDKLAGYDEPISFTTIGSYYAGFEDDMTNAESWYGETWTMNRWNDLFKRLFNVDFTYNWQAVVGGDYNTKLNLDIAAQELPDIFIVEDQAALMSLAQQGMIWDMTDVIASDATSYLTDVLWGEDDGLALNVGTYEGRNYGLTDVVSSTDDVRYLWIRSDWLKKLNLEPPKTLDDLEAIMEAFVTQDPDGNGVDDTWGIRLQGTAVDDIMRPIFAAYGAYPVCWQKTEDGTIAYGATVEGTKLALERIASWVKKGYINPETISGGQPNTEAITNGKLGIQFDGHWAFTGPALTLARKEPESVFECYALPSLNEDEELTYMVSPNVARGFVVVNSNFEHPELALKMMAVSGYSFLADANAIWWNWVYNSEGQGRTANMWTLNPVRLPESALANLDVYRNLLEFKEAGYDESVLRGQAIAQWKTLSGVTDRADPSYPWYEHYTCDPDLENTAYRRLLDMVDSGHIIYNAFSGARNGNQTFNDNWSAIVDAKQQMYIRIIYNQEDPDAVFDEWFNTWKALGGEEITQYVNDFVAANN